MTTLTAARAVLPAAPALPAAETSDEDLVRLIAGRDEAALATFYARYRQLAFAVAMRVVGDAGRAEDVLQDAFLAVWRKAATAVIVLRMRWMPSRTRLLTVPSGSPVCDAISLWERPPK